MKYIIEIAKEYEEYFKGILICGIAEGKFAVDVIAKEDLEELNSDYINEHYGDLMDEEIRQAVSEVREMKQMCGNINMKLTNIVTQRGQDWKKKLEAEYQRGLEDAWEAARKIFGYEMDGGIPIDEIGKVFGYAEGATFCTADILRHNTAIEAIEKLKAYEEKQKTDEIKVGDEVKPYYSDIAGVVTLVYGDTIYVLWRDGSSTSIIKLKDLRKTGRHFNISSILKEMQS